MLSLHLLPFLVTLIQTSSAHRLPVHHRHEAMHIQKRQAGTSTVMAMTTPLPSGVIAIITPSPGAAPVSVTVQSQLVTTYAPQFTLCHLPSVDALHVAPLPAASMSSALYKNVSAPVASQSSCSTVYSSIESRVCATTLTGLASQVPVTNCDQEVTFSTEYGYTLVTPTLTAMGNTTSAANTAISTITPGPSIQTLTTYFIAPWAELTAGTAPSDVLRKVCTNFTNGTYECIEAIEVWRTSLITHTATSTISLNFTATVHGPSQIIILETFVANITEILTTVTFQTSLETEYLTEIETTHTTVAAMTSTGPTVYETMTVKSATKKPTSTRTIHLTKTIYAGTTTLRTRSAQATSAASVGASANVSIGGN